MVPSNVNPVVSHLPKIVAQMLASHEHISCGAHKSLVRKPCTTSLAAQAAKPLGFQAGTRRNQQIMMEQKPFLARIENPIQLFWAVWGKMFQTTNHNQHYWLVVSTPLTNISQLGSLFPIYGKTVLLTIINHYHGWLSPIISPSGPLTASAESCNIAWAFLFLFFS